MGIALRQDRPAFSYRPVPAQPGAGTVDGGSYEVLSHVGGAAVLVPLFPVTEVIGVFSGDIRDLGA